MPSNNLPPIPLNMNSPVDLNARVVQYAQQDRAVWYYAATQTPVTLGAGLSATALFGLYNPVANTNNLIIRSIQCSLSADPAAASTILYTKVTGSGGNPSGVTGFTLNNGFGPIVTQRGVNFGVTATGVPFTAATLSSTPFIVRIGSDILTTTAPNASLDDYINGQIILQPGDQFAIQASAAVSGYFSMVWEESPWW